MITFQVNGQSLNIENIQEMSTLQVIINACNNDMLLDLLKVIPKSQWLLPTEENGMTLLHLACRGKNIEAANLLIASGANINEQDDDGWTPLQVAVYLGQSTMVQLLFVHGARPLLSPLGTCTLLTPALILGSHDIAEFLVINGVRLQRATTIAQGYISPRLRTLETSRLSCRDAIVALLGLKKRKSCSILSKLDRFLVRQELGVAIWTTRADPAWK